MPTNLRDYNLWRSSRNHFGQHPSLLDVWLVIRHWSLRNYGALEKINISTSWYIQFRSRWRHVFRGKRGPNRENIGCYQTPDIIKQIKQCSSWIWASHRPLKNGQRRILVDWILLKIVMFFRTYSHLEAVSPSNETPNHETVLHEKERLNCQHSQSASASSFFGP